MKFSRSLTILALSWLFLLLGTSCAKEEITDKREKDYGYVQFKLYKEASYEGTKSVVSTLDYLNDATKVKVVLQFGQDELAQTLTLTSSDSEAAEFGLRSEKLQLLAGEYQITSFTLYDKLDEELYYGGASGSFDVLPGGLVSHDLLAKATERGKVKFTLVKDFSAAVKSQTREYTFDEIATVDLTLKEKSGIRTTVEGLPAEFSIHFDETDDVEDGYQTSSSICDTLISLTAGTYVVESYTLYDADKILLETNSKVKELPFTVQDNRTVEADVPVTMNESAEYIKDYYALKTIWEALDGENWYYQGDEWPTGTNWDFNRDVDLWGSQPGVKVHDNGRVALISLSGFGFEGHMPAALGQLTELMELYLGNHNEKGTLDSDPTVAFGISESNRMARHKEYLRLSHIPTQFSEPIARGMKEHGVSIPEIALYESMTEDEIIEPGTGRMRIHPMDDVIAGTRTNGLKSLPEEISKLTKLEKIFIANGDLTGLPAAFADLKAVTDMEIYNCPKMTHFPMELAQMPSLVSLNISCNPQWTDVDEGLRAIATGPSAKELQILYMNECSLTTLPKELNNMTRLGLFSVASNKISKIESAYPDIAFTQLYLDDNQISEIPSTVRNGKRVFFRIEDVETFSCTYNKLRLVPDIFDAEAGYGITSIDFSYNEIEGFENENNGYQGVFVQTLSMTNNPKLTKYPKCLSDSKSKIDYINLRGCSINEIPKGSFTGENVKFLVSLDLSYNHLSDLPSEFHAVHMPYFYGIDLSYNRFDHFPWEPFDSAYLTMMALRGQRNEKGERCLKEWPTGMYNHKGLRAMYLGSNDLGKIEDYISYLIYYLDISDNPNIVFDASDICYYWQAGTYFLLYDKTQNIRNCEAMLN